MSHAALIEAYFDAIRARDAAGLASLFSADAELLTAARTFHGRDAIESSYRDLAFLVEDLYPDPGPRYPMYPARRLARGSRDQAGSPPPI